MINNKDYIEINDFSLINFFAYTLYTPLLISGPILSFEYILFFNTANNIYCIK